MPANGQDMLEEHQYGIPTIMFDYQEPTSKKDLELLIKDIDIGLNYDFIGDGDKEDQNEIIQKQASSPSNAIEAEE